MEGPSTDVDIVVLQVLDAGVADDAWLAEILNLLALLDLEPGRQCIERSVNRLTEAGLGLILRRNAATHGRWPTRRLMYQSVPITVAGGGLAKSAARVNG